MTDPRTTFMLQMCRGEQAMLKELAGEVTHPVEQYRPGSERLEKLYAAMEQAQRFSWPTNYEVNL